jgi:hypothetical protein
MPPFRPMLVGVLVSLAATCAFGQLAEENVEFQQPWPGPELQQSSAAPATAQAWSAPELVQPWPEDGPPLVGEATATDLPAVEVPAVETPPGKPLEAFLGYRYHASSMDWIVGNGDQFGAFSLNCDHYQPAGVNSGLGTGMKFHFLGGPARTDMPPRVFDFSLSYQCRDRVGPFGFDLAASVMASSDFEGSAREGIRFPGHAVGFLQLGPMTELVFGIDYLDRGDYKLLPVGGLILLPHPKFRLELVFPRPRAVFGLTDRHRLFVGGELGGGTWAVERDTLVDDLAIYRDLRVGIGLESVNKNGHSSALEIAYLFDRRLEYSSGLGDYRPNDTVLIRWITSY